MTEFVSVIMANFNGARFIETAVRSVLGQTSGELEVIVTDDASSDGSTEILESLATGDPRIRLLLQNERQGPALARNRSIEAARGRFIAFLDSDDFWEPDKIEKQLALHQQERCPITFTAFRKIDESGRFLSATVPVPDRVAYRRLLRSNVIPCSSAMYDTALVGKVFMPNIFRRQDFALWLKILERGGVAVSLPEPLLRYRVYSGQFSANKLLAARYHWKVLRDVQKLSLPLVTWYFAQYAIISGRKYILRN